MDAARFDGVREGGVEPPRPFGHWNLNPARLPIPPPAHWVCLPVLAPRAWRLPTSRTLARWPGWIHIPSPGTASDRRRRRHGPHEASRSHLPMAPRPPAGTDSARTRRRSQRRPARSFCRGHDRFTYQPRTGGVRLPRRRTESASGCGTLVCGPLYDPWQNDGHHHGRRSSKRSLGGNFVRRRHPAAGRTGGTSRSGGAWIRSVSSTR